MYTNVLESSSSIAKATAVLSELEEDAAAEFRAAIDALGKALEQAETASKGAEAAAQAAAKEREGAMFAAANVDDRLYYGAQIREDRRAAHTDACAAAAWAMPKASATQWTHM